ncbi:MAG: hypothetical protein JW770_01385 [Actinobacteria bacterium]|nr:hypothetical protein [Actinomycetota bacterium]
MEHLKEIISRPPFGPFLLKVSGDFLFSSFYILIVGLVIIGIVNLGLIIRHKEGTIPAGRPSRIWVVNLVLSCALVLLAAGINILFYLVRN